MMVNEMEKTDKYILGLAYMIAVPVREGETLDTYMKRARRNLKTGMRRLEKWRN